MNYRSASKSAALVVAAVLLLPLSRILAEDNCSCAKPEVRISAIHTITPATAVKVFFGEKDGAAAEVPPDAEPVEMERDKEYKLSVTLGGQSSVNCVAVVDLTFPLCGMEYSMDYGDTWIKGTRAGIILNNSHVPFVYTPEYLLIRITEPCADEENDGSDPGDEANVESTGPSYTYDGASSSKELKPPGIGMEIPMGSIHTPKGYKSAGLLVNYAPLGSSFAATANLKYNGIFGAGTPDFPHIVLNESSAIAEKHYVVPQGVIRVRGWDSATQSVVDWNNAEETLVEVYEREAYVNFNFGENTPHSFYRLEVVTGNGLQDGFRLVQSNHGEVKVRYFQASGDGLLLRDVKGDLVKESIAVPPSQGTTAWQAHIVARKNGVVISSVNKDYELRGTAYVHNPAYQLLGPRYVVVASTEDPTGAAGDQLTTYTSYYGDGRILSVSRPDSSWSYYEYDGNSTTTYSPWLSSSSLVNVNGVWTLPTSGMAVKTVSFGNASSITRYSYLVDLATGGPGILMSGSSSSKSTDSGYTRTTHITMRNGGNLVSYSLAYADDNTDQFLAGRTIMTWDATGRATLYQYEKGTWASSTFTQDEDGTAVRASAITGYIASPSETSPTGNFTAIPSHSTKEVTITAADGVVREETSICNGANSYSPALTRDHEYEATGQRRHTGIKIGGVHVTKTEYLSPSITREYDQDGTITETEINSLGETIRSTTLGNAEVPAVTRTYLRSGLATTTKVNGQVLSIETRDAAGRLVRSHDASGAVVTTSYGSGGRVVSRTAPGGVNIVEARHYDGHALSTTESGVIPRYHNYAVDSNGLVTTTTLVGSESSLRSTSVTMNQDGSTASESSPDPAGGTSPVVRTYHYASTSAALIRVTSSAANTAAQVRLDPANSAEAALGHYSLSGFETIGNGPVIASTDRLTETSTSYVSSGGVWNRQTVTRVFHTNGSDVSYSRTTLEALTPVAAGQGLRWISSTGNGTTAVTTTRDSFFDTATSVITTDDSATAISPDSVSISRHGREVSKATYGGDHPETMAYDASGRLIRHSSATGAATTYTYNAAGQLGSTRDHIGQVTSYTYHPANSIAAGLLWTSTNPEREVIETLYNSRGQVTETKGGGTYHVTYGYNAYGEKSEMRTYRSSNPAGDLTQWIHDPATGLLLTKIDAADKETNYTYYSNGLVHTRVRARSGAGTTTYTYNAFGDRTNTGYTDSTPQVTITPDRIGRPSQIADASGTRTLTYHPITGAVDLVSYDADALLPSLNVDYTWDTSLRPSGYAVSDSGPATGLAYDDEGRLLTVYSGGSTHTHGYIPGTGTLSSLTTTRGSTQILTRTLYHDRMRRLNGIANTNASGTVTRHGYALDGAGRRVRAIRENGQRWDYGYDDVGQVTSAVKKFPDASAIPGHTFAYAFDGIGNRTSATHGGTGNDVTYTPNGLNQYSNIATDGGRFILGEAPIGNGVVINGDNENPAARAGGLGFFWKHLSATNTTPLWSLDTIVSNGVTISGRTWTPAASVAPVHDFDGNLTYDGRWNYSWDAENRLTRMQTTHAAATAGVPRQRLDFVYDSQNRRVSKTVSTSNDGSTWTLASDLRFLYDGWNLIAEYEMMHFGEYTYFLRQATHVWGVYLSDTPQGAGGVGGLLSSTLTAEDQSGYSSYYPAFDGNGNVCAWVGQSGTLVGRMDYSPFGQLIAQYKFTQPSDTTLSRLHFGFSTKYTDAEAGFLYYGRRYYGPVDARWLSADPIGEDGGLNLYGFVGNDGVNGIDMLGLIEGKVSYNGKEIGTISSGELTYNKNGGIVGSAAEANGVTISIDFSFTDKKTQSNCGCKELKFLQFVKSNAQRMRATTAGFAVDSLVKSPYYGAVFAEGQVLPDYLPGGGNKNTAFLRMIDTPNKGDDDAANLASDLDWTAYAFTVCIKSRDGRAENSAHWLDGDVGIVMLSGIKWGYTRKYNASNKAWEPPVKVGSSLIRDYSEISLSNMKEAMTLHGNTETTVENNSLKIQNPPYPYR
jgi:RHS repeat-associated protein